MDLAPTPHVISEPRVHRKNVLGIRMACELTWGKTAYDAAVAELPAAVREATAGLVPLEEWIPETYIIAWTEAVWRGPARQDPDAMRRYISASIAHGFGRVRRFFLQMMAPDTIAVRAAEIWRQEHTTGELTAEILRPGFARAKLSDHPYIETPLMRLAIAEALRYIVSLARAENVVEKHASRGSPLVIDISWDVK